MIWISQSQIFGINPDFGLIRSNPIKFILIVVYDFLISRFLIGCSVMVWASQFNHVFYNKKHSVKPFSVPEYITSDKTPSCEVIECLEGQKVIQQFLGCQAHPQQCSTSNGIPIFIPYFNVLHVSLRLETC